MSTSCSDDLLPALVNDVRQACEQYITFKNFTSVSGLICFDIDGLNQQCFVISELVHKRSAGEGHSAHLKALNWKDIEEGTTIVSKSRSGKDWSPVALDPCQKNSVCDGRPSGETQLQRSLSGPQGGYASLHTKLDWSNRTFTLKQPDGGPPEPSFLEPLQNISTSTITVSKKDFQRDIKKSPYLRPKRDVIQGSCKQSGIHGSKWPKRNVNRSSAPFRNCYPGPPKKPNKTSRHSHNERTFDKHISCSSDSNSETLKEQSEDREKVKLNKALYNSPSEKPTALSWFEAMISPSSSVESIDSIKPVYLVPQSEPLSNPQNQSPEALNGFLHESFYHAKDEDIHPEYKHFASNDISSPLKVFNASPQETRQAQEILAHLGKQDSPLRTIAAHSTTSNGTLNTVSSIEPDLITVKERSPQRPTWKSNGSAICTPPSPGLHNINSQVFSECSTISKKRASLLKWMGLFRKGPKPPANTTSELSAKLQRNAPKLKQRGKMDAYPIPEPPIEIRVKQWH